MFVIVRRREKCAYVCIQAEWHPGNELGDWRVDEWWWPAASRLPQIQYSIFSIPQQRQQVQQLFAMAGPTGSSLATSASAFVPVFLAS